MSMKLDELTITLCSLAGPSGSEGCVCEYIKNYIAPFADEVSTDPLGNLLAMKRCGKPGAKTLLLDAHMDEIGLIVTAVEEGFLRFQNLGGVDPRVLPAAEVSVLCEGGALPGVICTMPPHVMKPGDTDKAPEIDKLCIDIGFPQEEAEKRVPPGTPVVFAAGCAPLGEGSLCGKALDDRSCAAIAVKAFEELSGKEDLTADLWLMISTQEEVGGRGAMTGSYAAAPEYAIVLDTTFDKTSDGRRVATSMRKGAAIGVGPNMNRAMTQELIHLAEEKGIPYQIEVCPGRSGTNAEEIQISHLGVVTALISLPIRYMHTPAETARIEDMESVLRLVTEYAASMEG